MTPSREIKIEPHTHSSFVHFPQAPAAGSVRIARMRARSNITYSDDYVEYCRETAKRVRNLQDLALRGRNKQEITRRIHERIVEAVGLQREDDLVDIGCGDGTLLAMAGRLGVKSAVGLLATEEEVELLRPTGLHVKQGFTDDLPIAEKSASVVVCNNVLLVVPREKIGASLREIYRIAKPGARILVGEIPFVQNPAPDPRLNTRREALSYLYQTYGFRTWFGMLRRMAYWSLTGKEPVIRDGAAISFYATAQEFIAMAEDAGLQLVRYWQHDDPNTRNNYLLRKASQAANSSSGGTATG
jgi:ubiquinone/menaquinone biosynthesis C-methylase UbiE